MLKITTLLFEKIGLFKLWRSVLVRDRPHASATLADQVDDQFGLEIGVDDDCVTGVLVLDQVGVGAELPVGGRLDAQPQRLKVVCGRSDTCPRRDRSRSPRARTS